MIARTVKSGQWEGLNPRTHQPFPGSNYQARSIWAMLKAAVEQNQPQCYQLLVAAGGIHSQAAQASKREDEK